jgi:hypothetical protein
MSCAPECCDLRPASVARRGGRYDYLNFRERSEDAADLFPAPVLERLRVIKREWDPDDVFQSNHPIRTA